MGAFLHAWRRPNGPAQLPWLVGGQPRVVARWATLIRSRWRTRRGSLSDDGSGSDAMEDQAVVLCFCPDLLMTS
jgi:hypothetical protein